MSLAVINKEKLNAALLETANAIRAKTGGTESINFEYPNGFKEAVESIDTETAYNEGFEEGFNKGNVLYYASSLSGVYQGVIFPENFDFVLKVKKLSSQATSIFNNAKNIKTLKIISEETNELGVNISHAFSNATDLRIIDFREVNNHFTLMTSAFYNCNSLISIIGALDVSRVPQFQMSFANIFKLVDIEFVKNTINHTISFSSSSALSDKSIQSIIDGLADLTGQTMQTLDFHSDIILKLTDEQWIQIADKNWEVI